MRFVQIEMLPAGKALVDIDKLTAMATSSVNLKAEAVTA